MSLLSGIDKLIASVAGPLVFERGQLLKAGSFSIDGDTGQTVYTPVTHDIKAIEEDYTAFHRASLNIPSENRIISILGHGVPLPIAGDQVSLRGMIWEIISVKKDPAGALYVCDSRPVEETADTGASDNLLSTVPGLIADIAGPLLFGDGVLYFAGSTGISADGQAYRVDAATAIRALEGDYSDFHRAQAGIPDTDKRMMILADGLSVIPRPGDRIAIDGRLWEVERVTRDPARAIYDCQSRPVGTSLPVTFFVHTGTLSRLTMSADIDVAYFIHNGTLARVQGEAETVALISVTHAGVLSRVIGSATAGADLTLSHVASLQRLESSAFVAAGVGLGHVGTLARVSSGAEADTGVALTHGGTLAPTILDAALEVVTPLAGVSLVHAGTLARVSPAGELDAGAVLSHAGVMARVINAATVAAAATLGSDGALARLLGSATVQNAVMAQSEGILRRSEGSASLQASTALSHGGTLARAALSASMAALPAITHAGTLARTSFDADITVESGPSYEAEAEALFARFTTDPGDTRKGHINTLIASLKAAGVWSKLDVLQVYAAHDSQAALLNWKSTSYNASLTGPNTPAHNTDIGFSSATSAGNTANHVATGFDPGSGSPIFSGTSSHYGFFSTKLATYNNLLAFYPGFLAGYMRREPSNIFGRIGFESLITVQASTGQRGHFMLSRNASTVQSYADGVAGASAGSDTYSNGPLRVLTGGGLDGHRFAAVHAGGHLSSTEAADLYDALDTYLTALGA